MLIVTNANELVTVDSPFELMIDVIRFPVRATFPGRTQIQLRRVKTVLVGSFLLRFDFSVRWIENSLLPVPRHSPNQSTELLRLSIPQSLDCFGTFSALVFLGKLMQKAFK